jgi:hypothetical protein
MMKGRVFAIPKPPPSKNNYRKGVGGMKNTIKNPTVKTPQEPCRFTKRIGSIVYEVEIHFNQDAKETMNDKLLRMIRRDLEAAS